MLHPEAPLIIRAILALHIAAGSLALIVVPIVMSVRKGGKIHRRLGLAYVYGMFVVAVTALVEAPYFKDYFLVLIAVFSSYLTFLGWRALARKRPERVTVAAVDWAGAILACTAGGGMIAMGLGQLASSDGFWIVLLILGGICVASSLRSIYGFFAPPTEPEAWLFAHFGNLLGAYIATVTAFSAVNFTFVEPIALRWLWPTILGTFAIAYNVRKYKRIFARGERVRARTTVA